MNLKLFFKAPKTVEALKPSAIGASIKSLTDESLDIAQTDIAIIGLTEDRGTEANLGVSEGADIIRDKFYRLKKSAVNYRIADLGNLQNGESLADTVARLREVCEFLFSIKVTPLIIGGTHDLSLGQYYAYESKKDLISVLNIDARLDVEHEGDTNETFLSDLITHQPNYLFSYNHLAHQSYLVDAEALAALDKLYFEAVRLGDIREGVQKAEPIIRMANMCTFDISAIRSADAPANANAEPFGLTGEEACQIMWYAGMNEKMSSVSISEYNPTLDDQHEKTAAIIGTMLWYFVEGYYHRKDTGQFNSDQYTKYTVSFEGTEDTMTFYKSNRSEKWWMLVTYGEKHMDRAYLPCSYEDYTAATHGEFPDRWIRAQGKLI
ncbi:formimidoylglutamase [Roseivirga pacifica]|uniref:formimidoylglutamase n=1 Tax=Roseivirga pacifica TaxID=1267423 RepID=UPI002095EE78|nr:formimidoylglutamase [Roseivirga pacifica]MCO6359043.1 formiminoglutamase [Roseivirga pacifica]MCO6365321.1 formiminoglutamase [Roseivirga pacifica]MCO6371949.1 formiminoglutamase [Roseivirga pacifica]MCO6375940.1 formiminoglutamase [Roseivirga pacifica]MCO6379327.1 formiminoglutamase [Roseivirga pacifica]